MLLKSQSHEAPVRDQCYSWPIKYVIILIN